MSPTADQAEPSPSPCPPTYHRGLRGSAVMPKPAPLDPEPDPTAGGHPVATSSSQPRLPQGPSPSLQPILSPIAPPRPSFYSRLFHELSTHAHTAALGTKGGAEDAGWEEQASISLTTCNVTGPSRL